jgi:hypothetical protein
MCAHVIPYTSLTAAPHGNCTSHSRDQRHSDRSGVLACASKCTCLSLDDADSAPHIVGVNSVHGLMASAFGVSRRALEPNGVMYLSSGAEPGLRLGRQNLRSDHDRADDCCVCSIFISFGDQAADTVKRSQSQDASSVFRGTHALQCDNSEKWAVRPVRVVSNPFPDQDTHRDPKKTSSLVPIISMSG